MYILQKPLITEKASERHEKNVYWFLVNIKAKKHEIKKEVEVLYKVKVSSINTMIYPVKKKNKYTKKGVISTRKSGYKKAIVQLVKGNVIDLYKT